MPLSYHSTIFELWTTDYVVYHNFPDHKFDMKVNFLLLNVLLCILSISMFYVPHDTPEDHWSTTGRRLTLKLSSKWPVPASWKIWTSSRKTPATTLSIPSTSPPPSSRPLPAVVERRLNRSAWTWKLTLALVMPKTVLFLKPCGKQGNV